MVDSSGVNKELRVGGFVPLTTTDLPGKLSAVVFCQGCPWACRYCHNTHLIPKIGINEIGWSKILDFLKKRRGLLDAVVFSGGEPTMQEALVEAVREVKQMGFSIGLHTAGQYPERLSRLLPLIEWVGMDIKAPFGDYQTVTSRKENSSKIIQSLQMIIASDVQYEFRTTVHSELLNEAKVLNIGMNLKRFGAKHFVLQMFRPDGCIDQELVDHSSNRDFRSVSEILRPGFDSFDVRNV